MNEIGIIGALAFFTYALCFMATIFGIDDDGNLPKWEAVSNKRNDAILMHGFFWLVLAIIATFIYREDSVGDIVLPIIVAALVLEGLLFIPNTLDHKKWRVVLWLVGIFGALMSVVANHYDI